MAQKAIETTDSNGKLHLSNILDQYTGEQITYTETTNITTDVQCDGVVYRKYKGKYLKRDFDELNVKWFGAKGNYNRTTDTGADDTIPLQKACSMPFPVFFPEGNYLVGTTPVQCAGGTIYRGVSATKSTITKKSGTPNGSVGALYVYSASETDYIEGTTFRDLGFDGRVDVQGHQNFDHLLSVQGTRNTLVENCKFYSFRGDGIYVGAGRSSTEKRRNEKLTVRNCLFDGHVKNNRNGISIIECDGCLIAGNSFTRIGNPLLSYSVACIDMERDVFSNKYARNVTVENNKFYDITSVNVACVVLFATPDPQLKDFFKISGNLFENCYWGITVIGDLPYQPLDVAAVNLIIENNSFKKLKLAIRGIGRKIDILTNNFECDAANPTFIDLGLASAEGYIAQDVNINDNSWSGLTGVGAVRIASVKGLTLSNNKFNNTNSAFYIFPDASIPAGRVLEGIRAIRNDMRRNSGTVAGNTFLWNIPPGIDKTVIINSTCMDQDNNILGGESMAWSTNEAFAMPGSTPRNVPAVGTWKAGDVLNFNLGNGTDYAVECVAPGTFVDTNLDFTGNVTNAGTQVDVASVRTTNLRVGQYLKIGASLQRYRIVDLYDTNVRITPGYDGVTATGVTINRFNPEFKIVNRYPVRVDFSVTGGGITTNSNQQTLYVATLTSDAYFGLTKRTNGLKGLKIGFRNQSATATLEIYPPGGSGVTLNGGTASFFLPAGASVEMFEIATNTWITTTDILYPKAAALTATVPTAVTQTSTAAAATYTQADVQKMVVDITNLTTQLNNTETRLADLVTKLRAVKLLA